MTVYIICLVFGLLFALICAFMGHLLGGHDAVGAGGHADAGLDGDGTPGVSFFSPTILATFVTAFGAVGLICTGIDATKSFWVSAPLAFIGSVLVSLGVLWFINLVFRKTQSSSEGNVTQLIGQTAAIVSPIPENGVGEISYVQFGSRYSAPARNDQPGPRPAGQTVRITRIVGSQFYVEPAAAKI